jgi:hypothetical protein
MDCCPRLHLLHCTAATTHAVGLALTELYCHVLPALAAATMHQPPAASQPRQLESQAPAAVTAAASCLAQKALLLLLLQQPLRWLQRKQQQPPLLLWLPGWLLRLLQR